MRDGVLIVDSHGRVLNANGAAEQLLGKAGESLVGSALGELLPDLRPAVGWSVLDALVEKGSSETVISDASGRDRFLEIVASSLGKAARGLRLRPGHARRSPSARRWRKTLRYRALHDELTGLPNRTLLREHLDRLLALQHRRKDGLTLLMIDLDRFKEINDTFGHEAGDTLLVSHRRAAAARRSGRATSSLAWAATSSPSCSPAVAPKARWRWPPLCAELSPAGIDLRNQTVCVAASIGVAVSPLHGRDAGTLLRHADVALYLAKDDPSGAALYDASLDPNSPARIGAAQRPAHRDHHRRARAALPAADRARKRRASFAWRRWHAGRSPTAVRSCPTSSSHWLSRTA